MAYSDNKKQNPRFASALNCGEYGYEIRKSNEFNWSHRQKNHSALFWCTRHYPKAKREAVYTLYALVKHFDDLSSSSLPEKDKADILAAWQREIANIYDRKVPETDIGRRIYKNCMRFKLPRACMETMLSGFAMDCPKPLFRPSLHEFEEYCRGVSETPSYLI